MFCWATWCLHLRDSSMYFALSYCPPVMCYSTFWLTRSLSIPLSRHLSTSYPSCISIPLMAICCYMLISVGFIGLIAYICSCRTSMSLLQVKQSLYSLGIFVGFHWLTVETELSSFFSIYPASVSSSQPFLPYVGYYCFIFDCHCLTMARITLFRLLLPRFSWLSPYLSYYYIISIALMIFLSESMAPMPLFWSWNSILSYYFICWNLAFSLLHPFMEHVFLSPIGELSRNLVICCSDLSISWSLS